MKRMASRVLAVTLALLVLAITFFALPVAASDDWDTNGADSDWWTYGANGELWDLFDLGYGAEYVRIYDRSLLNYTGSKWLGQINEDSKTRRYFSGGGGTFGGRGDGAGSDWWLYGVNGELWDLFDLGYGAEYVRIYDRSLFNSTDSKWLGQINEDSKTRRYFTGASGGGGTFGGRGSTQVEFNPSGGGGTFGGRGYDSGVATAYHGGGTTYTNLVNATHNTTTNNYDVTFNKITNTYNNTTNNYYETYNIQNIYYNNTYNTYRFETTNNYNFYVTYAPTFVNITYLDSASGSTVAHMNTHFFELPDGRSSWDLTAEEVFGIYFVYDAMNYDMVIEDEATLALYHFDGNLHDASAYEGKAEYLSGGSYNFVEHGGYDSALYWGNGKHALQATLAQPADKSTVEMMGYFGYPTNIAIEPDKPFFDITSAFWQANGGFNNRNNWNCPAPSYYLENAEFEALSLPAYSTVHTKNNEYRCVKTEQYRFRKVLCYLVTAGNLQLFPVYVSGIMSLSYGFSYYTYGSNGTGFLDDADPPNRIEAAFSGVSLSMSDVVQGQDGFGEWMYFAAEIGGGTVKQYVNGVEMTPPSWAVTTGGSLPQNQVQISKPAEWNAPWYLDELRVSKGHLYGQQYTPQAHPFDTNKVMVLPENAPDSTIAVKSNIPVGEMRVGGARPTYPSVGDVFIHVEKESPEKHIVKSAQQYQDGGWMPVDASIRVDEEWQHLKNYNLRAYTLEPGDVPNPGDDGGGGDDSSSTPSGGTGGEKPNLGDGAFNWVGDIIINIGDIFDNIFNFSGGSGNVEDEEPGFFESIWNGLTGAVGGFFKGLGNFLVVIVEGLGDIVGGVLTKLLGTLASLSKTLFDFIGNLFDALFSLVDFATRFGLFIGSAFGFIPPEVTAVIVAGLSLAVILMVIRFIRG